MSNRVVWGAVAISVVSLAVSLGLCFRISGVTGLVDDHLAKNPAAVLRALDGARVETGRLVRDATAELQKTEQTERLLGELRAPRRPDLAGRLPVFGDASAPDEIVVYSSVLCSFCARTHEMLRAFAKETPVRVYYKLIGADPAARNGALYFETLAARDMSSARAFLDASFARQADVLSGETSLEVLALQALPEAERPSFADTLSGAGDVLLARLEADRTEARSFAITGTPTFVVNGVVLRGAPPAAALRNMLALTGAASRVGPEELARRARAFVDDPLARR